MKNIIKLCCCSCGRAYVASRALSAISRYSWECLIRQSVTQKISSSISLELSYITKVPISADKIRRRPATYYKALWQSFMESISSRFSVSISICNLITSVYPVKIKSPSRTYPLRHLHSLHLVKKTTPSECPS